ncbi:hypothetical protein Pfo_010809 [Paulownia fortunei]|nr:hypothetical protein Pfo_010809 [Paulownia fortunei]
MLQCMLVDDNMSNLTSASNEASMSSSNNRNQESCTTSMYPLQHLSFASPNIPTQPAAKKKRNLPGHPDPDAEVVALSPKTLLATNRFVCEICNKGFQRDQNLQLHRRGNNLPWKLKQRSKKKVIRKKVYVCPEPSCVHHDPSRALGDLTGIKRHFCRKHGEKKWKCEKCPKRYAVQSDWKAHSKICGTREYTCDCGTLFSRRDSFITHRSFCDALAEERSRSITQNQILSSQTAPNQAQILGFQDPLIPLKQEIQNFNLPPWLSAESGPGGAGPPANELPTSPRLELTIQENPNPNTNISTTLTSSSLMSATALLQKAVQMGVTTSTKLPCQSSESNLMRPHHHMGAPGLCAASSTSTAGLSSREEIGTGFVHGLASFGNKAFNVTSSCMELQDMSLVGYLPSTSGCDGSSALEDRFNGLLNTKRDNSFQENAHLSVTKEGGGASGGAFPDRDLLNMAGLDQMGSSSYDQQAQNQAPWQS